MALLHFYKHIETIDLECFYLDVSLGVVYIANVYYVK
jgi:hypothetical protein